ncbi:MAG: UDP-N-acetylmuramate--L-alanine ligase [Flavobacteriaceae bacterium]|nr:UDP-N-acetylmuramate--L-alanine ligase [Flavobacteriaceae bacterium]
MNLDDKNNIYLIGIGGIGMSALARYFKAINKNVAGYDRTATQITSDLESLGIDIHFEDDIDKIDREFFDRESTLVIYTPAIPKTHNEFNYFKEHNYSILKRSEVLGLITQDTVCMAIAGTHGKTTTTSILGHLMHECGVEVTAFLGGISENYNSNLIQKGTVVTVVEADEFDRSFLNLTPDFACITSMDADHLDIYGEKQQLEASFIEFSRKLKPNGKLFINKGLPIHGISCAIESKADYQATNIKIENGTYVFDLKSPHGRFEKFKFNLPGRHNLSNALIALAMAIEYGCAPYRLASALASYKGVKRRFTYQIKTEDYVFIDDYAHHPEEINAVHQAIREMYPTWQVLVIFQPHLYSRTKDFVDEFASSLDQFDEVLLLDIYPARELPMEGVSSDWLLGKINNPNKKLIRKSEMVSEIQKSKAQVIMTLGAGDIGEEVEFIKENISIAS